MPRLVPGLSLSARSRYAFWAQGGGGAIEAALQQELRDWNERTPWLGVADPDRTSLGLYDEDGMFRKTEAAV